MDTENSAAPSPTVMVKLTVNVPADRRAEFMHLVQEFHAGKIRPSTPAVDFQGKGYAEAARRIMADQATSAALCERIVEDDRRDPLEALADAEVLHVLQSKRFAEAVPVGTAGVPGAGAIEQVGIDALRRLYQVAGGNSGQSRRVALFLLGLYNGTRFPFDLTDLRSIDDALFDDCMRVLRMDARLARREVHTYFSDGTQGWEDMAADWRVLDVHRMRILAKDLAEQVGFSGPHGTVAAALLDLMEDKR